MGLSRSPLTPHLRSPQHNKRVMVRPRAGLGRLHRCRDGGLRHSRLAGCLQSATGKLTSGHCVGGKGHPVVWFGEIDSSSGPHWTTVSAAVSADSFAGLAPGVSKGMSRRGEPSPSVPPAVIVRARAAPHASRRRPRARSARARAAGRHGPARIPSVAVPPDIRPNAAVAAPADPHTSPRPRRLAS